MAKLRFVPFVLLALNICGGLIAMGVNGATSGTKSFIAFNVLLALVAAAMFVRQSYGLAAKTKRAEAAMQAIARKVLDAPAEVQPKFESSLVGGAGMIAPGGRLDRGAGFTIEGEASGIAARIATLVSVTGRQMFEMSHTYSYVSLDRGECVGRLRLVGRDMYANLLERLPDHKLDDAAFDAGWIVAGDQELTRDLLDDALRAELVALQKRAHSVSQLGMSIELTGEGLVVRWPGELDENLAVTLRDLALRLRERLIVVLRAKGIIESVAGVRIQAAAGTLEAEAEAEAQAALEAVVPDDAATAHVS